MASDVEGEDGDEERWAEAESVLRAQPSEDARRRTRRRRTLLWSLIGGFTVLGAGLGVLLVLVLGVHPRHSDPSGWQVAAGLVVSLAGVVLGIVALVLIVKRGRWGQAYRSPAAVLTRRQRRNLLDQIRGRRPADPQRLALARDQAQRLEEQLRLLVPLYLAVVLVNVGSAASTGGGPQLWFAAVLVALLLLLVPFGGQQARQARRFLEEHPAPDD